MALTPTEQASVDRLAEYNGDQYDAATNPRGFGDPGYQTEFPRALNDAAIASEAVARLVGEADASADAAAGSATAAAGSAATAAGHAADAAEQVDLAVLAVAEAQAARAGSEAARDEAAALVASIEDGPVASVNGHTGTVLLAAADVGAVPTAALGDFADLEELAATVRLLV